MDLVVYRKNHGLTQAELARKLKVRQSAISRIEAGKRKPRPGLALRIAKMMEHDND